MFLDVEFQVVELMIVDADMDLVVDLVLAQLWAIAIQALAEDALVEESLLYGYYSY